MYELILVLMNIQFIVTILVYNFVINAKHIDQMQKRVTKYSDQMQNTVIKCKNADYKHNDQMQ